MRTMSRSTPTPPDNNGNKDDGFDPVSAYTALGILLLSKITYIFERGSLSYVYSFKAPPMA